MKCSVVILNWNGLHHLQRFLGSVVDNTPPEFEIVVADNGSSDNSLDWVKDTYPRIRTICLDKNYGYAGGYNKALKQIDSEIFVLLNSDVTTPKGWIEPLIEKLDKHQDIAALAPKILSEIEPTRFEYAGSAGGFIDIMGYPFCAGRIMESIEFDNGQYDNISQVFWASGACMVIRAEVFKRAGGFDADFFAHMEEIDLCWRIQAMGYKIAVENSCHVYHLGGGTLPQNNPRKLYLNYRNNLSMLFKNHRKRNLVWVIPTRLGFDMASAVIFCLQGHVDFSKAVLRAYRDFIKLLPALTRKRKAIKRLADHKCLGILKGSIVVQHMIYGKQYFSQIKRLSQIK
ncbi:MAG: glycosyltransferase family 2 protein [Rikenellaceae bacterium]